jgi:hypothetical protein
LRIRFGIGMNTDHTLEEVGRQFSVTRADPASRWPDALLTKGQKASQR